MMKLELKVTNELVDKIFVEKLHVIIDWMEQPVTKKIDKKINRDILKACHVLLDFYAKP